MKINYQTRQKITAQALQELIFARDYKQGKIKNWKINENLYYGRRKESQSSRANVDLGQMSSFVHTLLSKIDNPLVFKFTKRKESQLTRVKLLNALRTTDQEKNYWDIKDIVGKKQGVIYGRAIYSYTADSKDGKYTANLENVDVYDFLIDPSAGGIDIEKAEYMGRYGVIKTRSQLEAGVKEKTYLKTETARLIEGQSNATESNQEEVNKQSRTYDTNVYQSEKQISGSDKFKFWEWYTTYEGERYYVLLQESGATAIRIEKLSDIFTSDLFPFWTWASFLDLTEFWTPSYCDYVREIFMAQAVSVNQLLDNAEQINKPQKVVNVGAIENLAELKYRRDGYIKVKKDFDIDKAVQTLNVPAISTPIDVFQMLEGIREKSSGVSAATQGLAEEDKVGIYEGNQANAADRFGLLNKSYAFGYDRFAKLYEWGVRDHLSKKVSVDILGPDGVELVEVSRRDIFRKNEEFGVMVESSSAALALSEGEKRTQLQFLQLQSQNPMQNPQKAYELQATIAGFDEDTIRQLQDSGDFGDAKILSEAERDIERILDGDIIEPNARANTAYKQKFVDYMTDHKEDIDDDQFDSLVEYVTSLEEIIIQNMIEEANRKIFKEKIAMLSQPQEQMQQGGQAPPMINNDNGGIPPEQNYGI